MSGHIDILNVGEGHLEVKWSEGDVIEQARAERIIQDMLKRGYALFVHGTDGALLRVKAFDVKHSSYIIADGPTVPSTSEEIPEQPLRRCKASRTKATVVGRSAGG